MTLSRPRIRELLAAHGADPKRSLGQNFVADPNTVRRIARLAEVGPGDHVVEIGPGVGSLTLALAETGAAVTAVEIDDTLVEILADTLAETDVRVLHGDATTLDWSAVLGDDSWVLVANLPYNVSSPLVLDLLDTQPQIASMLVMVQREVGERLAAQPGTAAYGLPSVKVTYWATAEVVGSVSAEVFVPKPRVESVLVRIARLPRPAVDAPEDVIFSLARAGFAQRRKMLRRSLRGLVDDAQFVEAGIDGSQRAETLGIEQWAALAEVVDQAR